MKIRKVLIGNFEEAFIEDRFTSGVNIISSDDNNKGKTIVIQSIMYAIGNDPIFPSSFNYKDYYYIVEIEIENQEVFSICRKGNSFIVLHKCNISVFDSLAEFKYYINKNIFNLPSIMKEGFERIVDPFLFYQIFFVGQDNKNSSNIFLSGYYNKQDFENMIYRYYGLDINSSNDVNINDLKTKLKLLKAEKKEFEKQNKILKSAFSAIGIASMSNNRQKFEEKLTQADKLKDKITNLNSKRNIATSRKIKNEITLKELRSLNNSLTVGKLHCLDCNSTNIGYATSDMSYSFDISSIEIRNQILSSIKDKVQAYSEEMDQLTIQINEYQQELMNLLSEEEVSIESLLMYKPDLVDASEADSKITKINKKISEIQSTILASENSFQNNLEEKELLYSKIVEEMNTFYKQIDPHGNLIFNNLFSKRQSVFSGVEETEFYLAKLFALRSILIHNFPIIMDYFRDGELSSNKEKKVIELFSKFENQVIFTATLKQQEKGKYNTLANINHIDYMSHTPSKLLNIEFREEFLKEIKKFSILL